MKLKDMMGFMVEVPIATSAITMVGNVGTAIPEGIKSVTQIGVGLGLAGDSFKLWKIK